MATARSKALKGEKDMGMTKRGHNKLLKEKYGSEYGATKKYLKNFKFKDGHYE
jgi:hypothetical protein